ncbi:GAF domain-containing protein [Halobacillus sp. A1]|uniref:GAF domain-containing protein n=1 Tax=Halobacillus sp. A1 TaxID=2880262 RepID=UPI0020A676E4|nr:GAF domain-containing protein [Halobacillus sp. A1]MCP3031749.1 GAF domain-containing protein [Halobacillus sp. A1]
MNTFANDLQYRSLEEAADDILHQISFFLGVNTVYIAKKEPQYMQVLKSYNRSQSIVDNDLQVNYEDSYCQFVMETGEQQFNTSNLSEEEATAHMNLAQELGVKSFLGVKIYDKSNHVFGTLCVMDPDPIEFTKEQIAFLKSIAKVFSFIVNLDQTKQQVELLSTPIVPITEGVVVLPLVGIVNEDRADKLLPSVLQQVHTEEVDYFIFDLSGLVSFDDLFSNHLFDVIHSLELMGVKPVLTGVRPDMAMAQVKIGSKFKDIVISTTLEQALNKIGYHFVKK